MGVRPKFVSKIVINFSKSVASFCYQVAAWVPHTFCHLYLLKNGKSATNSTTSEARKSKWNLETIDFENFMMYACLNLKTIKLNLIKLAPDYKWKPTIYWVKHFQLAQALANWPPCMKAPRVQKVSIYFLCLWLKWTQKWKHIFELKP